MTDAEREVEIDRSYQSLLQAPDADAQRAAFSDMSRLINERSQAQIERMERERGLRA